MTPPRLLTLGEVAARLSVSRRTASRVAAALPIVYIGRCVRVDERDLDSFIAAQKESPWDTSTSAARSTGPSGRTRVAARTDEACEPATEPSPANDSARPSWLRPLRVVRDGNG